MTADERRFIEAVREACLEAAIEAYEYASVCGLCAEGAWECAVGAIKFVKLETVAQKLGKTWVCS
jgi:hypothetical protein